MRCSPDPQRENIEQIISLLPSSLAAAGASPPRAVPSNGDATLPATQPPQEQEQQRRARQTSSSLETVDIASAGDHDFLKAAASRRLDCCRGEQAWPSSRETEALVCCGSGGAIGGGTNGSANGGVLAVLG